MNDTALCLSLKSCIIPQRDFTSLYLQTEFFSYCFQRISTNMYLPDNISWETLGFFDVFYWFRFNSYSNILTGQGLKGKSWLILGSSASRPADRMKLSYSLSLSFSLSLSLSLSLAVQFIHRSWQVYWTAYSDELMNVTRCSSIRIGV